MTDEVDTTQDKAEDAEVQKETIDDLFEESEKPKAEPESKGETEVKAEAKAEAKTEEPAKTAAETPAAKEESVPIKALTEERRKRQEAEKRAQELEDKFKATAQDTKVPDPIEDPQGYAQYMEDKSNLDALRVKVNLSRDLMLDLKEDYAEKEQVFVELAKANPFLVQQMNASPNPAKFAYRTATEHLEVKKYKDPKFQEQLRAELKEQIRKELLEELKQEGKPGKKSALDVPDLTKATAAGKNSDTAVKEVVHVNDVLQDSPF